MACRGRVELLVEVAAINQQRVRLDLTKLSVGGEAACCGEVGHGDGQRHQQRRTLL
jgi:hypothetical protein